RLRAFHSFPTRRSADLIEAFWSPMEKIMVEQALKYSFVGAPDTVEQGLKDFLAEHQPDELMITALVHDNNARLRTLELVAEIRRSEEHTSELQSRENLV